MNEPVAPASATEEKLPFSVRLRRYLGQLFIRIVIYLLAYLGISVLTIGPCYWSWYEATYVGGSRWVAKFYAPLYWLCVYLPPLRWLINLYVDWWNP